jgi:hypothetical protein
MANGNNENAAPSGCSAFVYVLLDLFKSLGTVLIQLLAALFKIIMSPFSKKNGDQS